jgi:hypothetical protein
MNFLNELMDIQNTNSEFSKKKTKNRYKNSMIQKSIKKIYRHCLYFFLTKNIKFDEEIKKKIKLIKKLSIQLLT